jgi:hypothetical protein
MQGTVAPGIKLQTFQIRERRADQRLTSAVIRPEERNKMSESSQYYGQSRNVLLSHGIWPVSKTVRWTREGRCKHTYLGRQRQIINEEIKNRLNYENSHYDAIQNLISVRLLPKIINLKSN